MESITNLKREVDAILIPQGENVTLMPGTEVIITQALGDSFTLNINGNLVRLAGADADAIGKPVPELPSESIPINGDVLEKDLLWAQLSTCYDPEIPVNIVELGLIYDLTLNKNESGRYHIGVTMTLTAPGCGMGPVLTAEVEAKLMAISLVEAVDVVLVFDPPWHSDMMSEAAKLELGVL